MRMKFASQSERFNPEQKSLLEDEIEANLAAVATEIDALQEAQAPAKFALQQFARVYEIEREVKELQTDQRRKQWDERPHP